MKESITPQEIVREALARLRQRNPRYSNNALAKAVGVSPSFISQFLGGKKSLSTHTAVAVAAALKMTKTEEKALVNANSQNLSKEELSKEAVKLAKAYRTMARDQQLFLSRWYHIAIAELALCEGYQHDPKWVAERLGISAEEAKQALARLERLEVLRFQGGRWRKATPHLKLPTQKSLAFVRQHHVKMMEKAGEYMHKNTSQEDFAEREIKGRMMPVNKKKMKQAKKLIDRFLNEMTLLMDDGDAHEVYQLGIQFFPVSKSER